MVTVGVYKRQTLTLFARLQCSAVRVRQVLRNLHHVTTRLSLSLSLSLPKRSSCEKIRLYKTATHSIRRPQDAGKLIAQHSQQEAMFVLRNMLPLLPHVT